MKDGFGKEVSEEADDSNPENQGFGKDESKEVDGLNPENDVSEKDVFEEADGLKPENDVSGKDESSENEVVDSPSPVFACELSFLDLCTVAMIPAETAKVVR